MRRRRFHSRWFVIAFAVFGSSASAQVTTEEGASLLFFPTVIADGTSDTLIQIANGSLLPRSARCFYVSDPGSLDSSSCRRESFLLSLVARQPTHWLVSKGRQVDVSDPSCDRIEGAFDCDGAGFDPGRIPAQPSGFRGHLVCVQVDASGAPVGGNALRGQATITAGASGDVAKYNAIGLPGFETNDGDDVLCLGGTKSERCPMGAEYGGCPETWILEHSPDGTEEAPGKGELDVATSLTIVPCAHDLTGDAASSASVSLTMVNELEQAASASSEIGCRAEFDLSDLSEAFGRGSVGTDFAQTFIAPDPESSGVIVSARSRRTTISGEPASATSAIDVHAAGVRARQELILLPPILSSAEAAR